MSRLAKILVLPAACAVALATAACGTQRISVPKSRTVLHRGAVLFSQRCAGCHTLSAAATFGSAPNIRTAQANSGPDFDQRCERPLDRVLYAISNGGFSGAYMPQNVVVGQDAVDVAKFVATYAGRQAAQQTGQPKCQAKPLGAVPSGFLSPTATTAASSGGSASPASTKVRRPGAKPVAAVSRRHSGAKPVAAVSRRHSGAKQSAHS